MQRFLPAIAFALLAIGAATAFGQTGATTPQGSGMLVYFGTYTGPKSKGIYVSRLDPASGALTPPELAAETPSPSFLALRPGRDFLYAVNEVNTFGGKPAGSVTGFAFDRKTGKLTQVNQESAGGPGPAHLVVDKTGGNVLVANYGGGSITVLPIAADGSLKPASAFVQHTGSGTNPQRQKEPHAHAVQLDPDNRVAYVADLGLDKVLIYRFDAAKGTLTPNDPPFASVAPGAGARHVAIGAGGRFAYVINEINCTVTAFTRDAKSGGLTELQTLSTLPAGETVQRGFSTAEIAVHPSGKFLYGSNRGHDSLVVYTIDERTGRLTYVENQPTQGKTPRGFGIDPTGRYLLALNQGSDSVIVFRIDAQTGRLTAAGHQIEIGSPVDVKFIAP
ncbi:MAG: lactonase family protein [Acidobacteriota bacterium]